MVERHAESDARVRTRLDVLEEELKECADTLRMRLRGKMKTWPRFRKTFRLHMDSLDVEV